MKQNKRITPHDTRNPGQYISSSPKMHQRKPSIMPTIGLIEYSILHSLGMMVLLNPTGDTYKPNCTMNGIMYLKSRYFTLSAVIYKLIPNEAKKAKIVNN